MSTRVLPALAVLGVTFMMIELTMLHWTRVSHSVSTFDLPPDFRGVVVPGMFLSPATHEKLFLHVRSWAAVPCVAQQPNSCRPGRVAFLHGLGENAGVFGAAADKLNAAGCGFVVVVVVDVVVVDVVVID
jgi:hypothetical protein